MKRILIVDDNADSRYSLRLLLDGYDVLEAGGGEEAIDLARAHQPNCILLDIEMPGMDGFEVCRRLRSVEETRTIPIILVTGHYRDTQSLVKGLAAGGDEYVTKPVSQQELRARVEAMLRIENLQNRLEVLNAELDREVRRRTEELRQIYLTVPVGIYTLDATGRITSFNSHVERMLGYASEEIVGRSIADVYGTDYDALYWLDLCRREGRTAAEGEARRKDGTRLPVFDERVVTEDHLGEHVGFTGYMQDLSQRQRMRQLLKEQEVQAGVGRLTAMIVHEITNPISGVSQYLDAMLQRLQKGDAIGKEELQRGAGVMRDALRRTTDLIRQLRGFARAAVRPVTGVDPCAILSDLHALMRHDLYRHGIEMTVTGEPGRFTVRGDAGRLSQVFLNLITNARDAMQGGGRLVVEARARDSSVHVSFKDTGVGIPPENMGRIFDFLFTTKGEKGTGYGLTISKDIVEEHGGRIEVSSEPGRGSTFTVILPLESGPRVA
ncbi:MAG: ATP-binding protein [Planctomycetota bacterium]